MHIYLIRHGQSFVNLVDWAGGNRDTALTDLGRRQAAALANWLPTYLPAIDILYASTMQRARETAAPLAAAYGAEICWDDHLRELGTSRFDHSPWPASELPNYPDYWASERPFTSITPSVEGGETLMHFRTRVGSFLEKAVQQHRGQVVVAVCHGGVIDVSFDHVFNVGPWRRTEVWNHNTGITHFEYIEMPRRETWRLHFQNRAEHLIGVD